VVGFSGGHFNFSGSLYLLAVTDLNWFGAVTPAGGVGFWRAGWRG